MIIQEPVQAAIWHCLNHYDFQNATFLAERLCAEVDNEETIHLLATCYYRSNKLHQAYWLLQSKSPRSPQCRYLLAKCAYQLKKLAEAESALSNVNFAEMKNFDDVSKEFGEVACFALQLIAKICTQTERYKMASEAYKKALKLNPFLWHVFADLCDSGEKCDPNAIFQFSSTDIFNTCQGNNSANSVILFGAGLGTGGGGGLIMSGSYLSDACTIGADQIISSSNLSCNYILSTPVDQIQTNRVVPNNNSFNNSILRGGQQQQFFESLHGIAGGTGGGGVVTLTLPNTSLITGSTIETTPIMKSNVLDTSTPFRKQFKYLSALSPTTPSFGILPISPSDTSLTAFTTSPAAAASVAQTLVEVNQEQQKILSKKLKGHVGNIINRKDIPLQQSKPAVFNQTTGNITPRASNALTGQNVRRSSRLFSNSNYSVKENNKSPNINKFAQPRSPPRKTKQRLSKISALSTNELNEKDTSKEKIETITSNESKILLNNSLNSAQTVTHQILTLKKQSAEGLMSLLREIGVSFQLLSQFNCKEAIQNFSMLPKHHCRTSWVQSKIALAHYELREYEQAVSVFREVHESDPHRLDLMEVYSTALWHLQREVHLSALAQNFMQQDKNSPVTWCVAGNCFSLHKEHETAIKFLKRAVQIDPEFVYSYTLLGHELVTTEELDKAMSCFRTAILKNPRHYNAWFGIGTIYAKQERYELAELHYRRALKINPKNSVLMVHVGAMQFFMTRSEKALQTLNDAITLDPKNPLCKFHRGSMYYSMGKHQEALRELEELKQVVPKESVVFYLIGKIHKHLGNIDLALMHFSWATDLDPKGANNQLKDAFDSINHTPVNDSNVDGVVVADGAEPHANPNQEPAHVQLDLYDSDSY